MHAFRVPFPTDPASRETKLHRLRSLIGGLGEIEGDHEAGTFHGSTPFGRFAGSYRSVEGTGEIEIVIDEKPFFVSHGRIESEARRFLTA